MKPQSPLGYEDILSSGVIVPAALEELFHTLRQKLPSGLNANNSPDPIFSSDAFDSQLAQFGVPQADEFEQAVLKNKIPHGCICHMRLYSTASGAHWHALFAKLNAKGDIKEIIVTDSRQKRLNQGYNCTVGYR